MCYQILWFIINSDVLQSENLITKIYKKLFIKAELPFPIYSWRTVMQTRRVFSKSLSWFGLDNQCKLFKKTSQYKINA